MALGHVSAEAAMGHVQGFPPGAATQPAYSAPGGGQTLGVTQLLWAQAPGQPSAVGGPTPRARTVEDRPSAMMRGQNWTQWARKRGVCYCRCSCHRGQQMRSWAPGQTHSPHPGPMPDPPEPLLPTSTWLLLAQICPAWTPATCWRPLGAARQLFPQSRTAGLS